MSLALLPVAGHAATAAKAEQKPKLHLDFEALTRIALSYARPTSLAPHSTFTAASAGVRAAAAQTPTITLAPERGDPLTPVSAQFDDVDAGHRIRWHYDDVWSGSVSSDYPRFALPVYQVGNGAPGVPQKVWFQFTFVHNF